jgi:hypothetical protein
MAPRHILSNSRGGSITRIYCFCHSSFIPEVPFDLMTPFPNQVSNELGFFGGQGALFNPPVCNLRSQT